MLKLLRWLAAFLFVSWWLPTILFLLTFGRSAHWGL